MDRNQRLQELIRIQEDDRGALEELRQSLLSCGHCTDSPLLTPQAKKQLRTKQTERELQLTERLNKVAERIKHRQEAIDDLVAPEQLTTDVYV